MAHNDAALDEHAGHEADSVRLPLVVPKRRTAMTATKATTRVLPASDVRRLPADIFLQPSIRCIYIYAGMGVSTLQTRRILFWQASQARDVGNSKATIPALEQLDERPRRAYVYNSNYSPGNVKFAAWIDRGVTTRSVGRVVRDTNRRASLAGTFSGCCARIRRRI